MDANRRADGAGEEVVAVVRMGPTIPPHPVTEQVRFRRNGTLEDPRPFTVELVDERASLDRVLSVAFGGRVRVEE